MARRNHDDDEDSEPAGDGPQPCDLCGRIQPLTFHHLIPKALHKRNRYQKRHTKDEMRTRGLMICQMCHNGIHIIIPNKQELATLYDSQEALLAHPGIARHVAWVRKQR